jgi:hypothetical protein
MFDYRPVPAGSLHLFGMGVELQGKSREDGMNAIPYLRWSGRLLGALAAMVVAIDILTDRFGYAGLLDFRRTHLGEQALPVLVVTGALGLTYAWHREEAGARIAAWCGAVYGAICAFFMSPLAVWAVGGGVAMPALLLLAAERLERREGGDVVAGRLQGLPVNNQDGRGREQGDESQRTGE